MLDQLLDKPGAGGVGAVLAAIIVLISAVIVSYQRRTEHTRNLILENRKQALESKKHEADRRDKEIEQWWTRYTWLIDVEHTKISVYERFAILRSLERDAVRIVDPTLSEAVQAYEAFLTKWIAKVISRVTTEHGEEVGANGEESGS